jgi:putative adenylate-forming enzyme
VLEGLAPDCRRCERHDPDGWKFAQASPRAPGNKNLAHALPGSFAGSERVKTLETVSILRHFVWARWRAEHLHGEKLERFQDTRAKKIVQYALKHSPFYQVFWSGHNPEHWRTLPTLGKPEMLEHFSSFNTRGISRADAFEAAQAAESGGSRTTLQNLTAGLSSGTSGTRGLFLVSKQEQAAWTGTILARVLNVLKPERVALFLRAGSDLYEGVGRGKFIQFRYFPLTLDLERILLELNEYRPSLVIGPASLLERVAQHIERLTFRPDRWIAVAETLEPQDKTRLERIFQGQVHQIYQATEGFLAASCRHGRLHLQEDIVGVQLEGLPLEGPSEGTGERHFTPILTDLWRRVQPIVRYRLGDVLRLQNEPCKCGSSWRTVQVEGRLSDLFQLEDLHGHAQVLFPDVLRQVIFGSSAQIQDYAAVQDRSGHLRIYLALTSSADLNSIQAKMCALLEGHGFRDFRLELISGLPGRPLEVKRRRMVRLEGTL